MSARLRIVGPDEAAPADVFDDATTNRLEREPPVTSPSILQLFLVGTVLPVVVLLGLAYYLIEVGPPAEGWGVHPAGEVGAP